MFKKFGTMLAVVGLFLLLQPAAAFAAPVPEGEEPPLDHVCFTDDTDLQPDCEPMIYEGWGAPVEAPITEPFRWRSQISVEPTALNNYSPMTVVPEGTRVVGASYIVAPSDIESMPLSYTQGFEFSEFSTGQNEVGGFTVEGFYGQVIPIDEWEEHGALFGFEDSYEGLNGTRTALVPSGTTFPVTITDDNGFDIPVWDEDNADGLTKNIQFTVPTPTFLLSNEGTTKAVGYEFAITAVLAHTLDGETVLSEETRLYNVNSPYMADLAAFEQEDCSHLPNNEMCVSTTGWTWFSNGSFIPPVMSPPVIDPPVEVPPVEEPPVVEPPVVEPPVVEPPVVEPPVVEPPVVEPPAVEPPVVEPPVEEPPIVDEPVLSETGFNGKELTLGGIVLFGVGLGLIAFGRLKPSFM